MYYFCVVLFALFASSYGLSCTQQSDCLSVTTNYNYAHCVSGQCQCVSTFAGSATSTDKCRCNSPGNVYYANGVPECKVCQAPSEIIWQNGNPYCVNPPECETLTADAATQAFRQQQVMQIYQNLVYPTPFAILQNTALATQFAPTVRGRVTPVGKFNDFNGVLEYFYALAIQPGNPVVAVDLKALISTGDKVGVRVDILFNNSVTGLKNLTQTGFFQFNSNNQVFTFDLAILNLGAAVDVPQSAQSGVIQGVCYFLTVSPATCPHEYTDFNDCVNFMSNINYGSWNRANSNTTVCRQLHTLLTKIART